jgi:hypothetical protein
LTISIILLTIFAFYFCGSEIYLLISRRNLQASTTAADSASDSKAMSPASQIGQGQTIALEKTSEPAPAQGGCC